MAERNRLIGRVRDCILAGLLLISLANVEAPARATPTTGNTFLVNSTLDEPDADPSSPICSSTPSGKCTLRAAIMRSNFVTGPNTIVLPSGTYVITRPGYDNNALIGDLDIGNDLTIQGAGPGTTIVDGNGAVTGDRVFKILASVQNASLADMTIRNGKSISSTVGVIGGGGLYMEGVGHLGLSNVIFDGNTGQNGGGLYANLSAQGGSVAMDHVIVRSNTVTAGGVGAGGGVFAHLPSSSSTFTVQNSQVYSNAADGTGGGFYVDGSNGAHWQIGASEVYSNTAASGGGIGNFVPLALTDSHLHDNHATFDGGAIEAFQPVAILRTTLDANTAGRFGGGIFDLDTNGSALYRDFDNIAESTLSGNSAQYGGGIYHDGFISPNSSLMLTNSTLSGNAVSRNGDGGGIYVYGGQAQLYNATIASNRVQLGFPFAGPGIGGGLYITATAVLTAENSLIANNTRGNGITLSTEDDCFSSGTTGTLAYNLVYTTTNCFVTGPQGGNIVNQAPLLGPLQNNGGSTQTQALLPGSPAIHSGFPAGCTGAGGSPITIDQRSATRPASGCDIGAYTMVPEADLSIGKHHSPVSVTVGATLSYTIAVTNNGPSTANGVLVTDPLLAGVVLKLATPTQGSCSGTVTVTCNLGILSNGATATVTLAVTPMASGVITNTVTAAANEFDPVTANNTTSDPITVLWSVYLPLVERGP